MNSRGQPQARHLIWNCIPLLPLEPHKEPSTQPGKHSAQALEKVRKLLRLLNDNDKEAAVVTAIDVQGGADKPPTEQADAESQMPEVDYVTYVLDRLGTESEAVTKIKDFVKMLLLLMLAKMLKKRTDAAGVQKLTQWLSLLADSIDPTTEKQVQEHFIDVVSQIESNLRQALEDNGQTKEVSVSSCVLDVIKKLKSKSPGAGAPAIVG